MSEWESETTLLCVLFCWTSIFGSYLYFIFFFDFMFFVVAVAGLLKQINKRFVFNLSNVLFLLCDIQHTHNVFLFIFHVKHILFMIFALSVFSLLGRTNPLAMCKYSFWMRHSRRWLCIYFDSLCSTIWFMRDGHQNPYNNNMFFFSSLFVSISTEQLWKLYEKIK